MYFKVIKKNDIILELLQEAALDIEIRTGDTELE